MGRHYSVVVTALLTGSILAAYPVRGAEVTPERLLNPDKEPQNWLMNHRTYNGQRYSPLAGINRDNIRNLKLAIVGDRKSTRLNSSHRSLSRMPSSA